MLGTELEEVSCFADGYLCISNNNLMPVFSGKEVVSSRKNLFLKIKEYYCGTKIIIGRFT